LILYRTKYGFVVEQDGAYTALLEKSLDVFLTQDDLRGYLATAVASGTACDKPIVEELLAPVGSQEIWASGVTYYRSRSARIEESKDAGGGDFYDRVYTAERPELFFKAVGHKVVGPGGKVRIRSDAKWSVPEPELTLVVSAGGAIVGYTVGNDMSSRDIEGTNPLYLPQAKVYDGSCAIGPGILIAEEPLASTTKIAIEILRGAKAEFTAETQLAEMKRDPKTLVEYLFRDQTFAAGCFLLTGTGIVPPDSFTLASGDEIRISIEGIGTLSNVVA
jgi:2-dehydro-3-deoxy-D-arabinonate dehydratase